MEEVVNYIAAMNYILELRETHRRSIAERLSGSTNGLRLLDYLFQQPVLSVGMPEKQLQCAYVTAGNLIQEFSELGILVETTGRVRNRRFQFQDYLKMFERQLLRAPLEPVLIQTTSAGHRKKPREKPSKR